MPSPARVQLITPSGASFKIENGALVPRAPSDAPPRIGDVVQIKTVVTHEMEPGYRKKPDGTAFPRNIIQSFSASFGGRQVFAAEFGPGVSANPYLAFFVKIAGPGELELRWRGDHGFEAVERIGIPVA